MFSRDDIVIDDYQDEVGRRLERIARIPTHTAEKRLLVSELIKFAAESGYIKFSAGNHRWHIGRIGESYLYCVPEHKSGYLRRFRGRWVRVVCVGSGTRWIRSYLVGLVSENGDQTD